MYIHIHAIKSCFIEKHFQRDGQRWQNNETRTSLTRMNFLTYGASGSSNSSAVALLISTPGWNEKQKLELLLTKSHTHTHTQNDPCEPVTRLYKHS